MSNIKFSLILKHRSGTNVQNKYDIRKDANTFLHHYTWWHVLVPNFTSS